MKKTIIFLSLLLTGVTTAFAVEDMRFVTTLSAPLAVFDKIETSTAAEPAKAAKASVGALSSTSFNTTLKLSNKNARIHNFQMEKNTNFTSSTLPIWKTPKIAVNKGGSLRGKKLQATAFDFKGSGVNSIISTNADITSNIAAASGTATENLYIANKIWYQSVENVPQAGNAAWGSVTAGSDGTKTFTNILNYNGPGPRATGASSGKWQLVSTTQYFSCSSGSVLRDTCQDVAGRSGNGIANVSCTLCGVSCSYIPCVSTGANYVYQEYKYTCTC